MKRVRECFGTNNEHGKKLSYFHCGEYGEACRTCKRTRKKCICPTFIEGPGRPHYHAILFGVSFVDQVPFKPSGDGSMVFTSDTLSRLWPAGFSTVGAVTFESAAYVARYSLKKKHGAATADWYSSVDPETGEVEWRLPEYTTMSLKPAIGKNWYSTFKSDVYPSDFLVVRGQKMKPPKYYDRLHQVEDEIEHQRIKENRKAQALLRDGDSSTARLRVREKVKLAKIKQLKRDLE